MNQKLLWIQKRHNPYLAISFSPPLEEVHNFRIKTVFPLEVTSYYFFCIRILKRHWEKNTSPLILERGRHNLWYNSYAQLRLNAHSHISNPFSPGSTWEWASVLLNKMGRQRQGNRTASELQVMFWAVSLPLFSLLYPFFVPLFITK